MTGRLFDMPPGAEPEAPSWADTHKGIIDNTVKYLKGRRSTGPGHVQRHVRVGFLTARRVLEVLEDRGIVGPANGNGVRPVLPAWAVGDRVLITGKDHPWKGHTGTISGPFSSEKDPGLKWTVAVADGFCEAAVAENEIRRVQ